MHVDRRGRRLSTLTIVIVVVLALLGATSQAQAARFAWIDGYDDPGTPNEYDKVGVVKQGPADARKILVLAPGTSASAALFAPLARDILSKTRGWQVWSVERRENLLEDQSVVDRAKRGEATPQELFDYYLGFLVNGGAGFKAPPDLLMASGRGWGMRVAVEDLKKVIEKARKRCRTVVLGGHSLGGSIASAYATWDFDGDSGAEDLSGLVFIDGGSGPATLTAEQATTTLADLARTTPWLSFGGIPAPFAGIFSTVGSTLAKIAPNDRSQLEGFPYLPSFLRPPVSATNEAGYGYAIDTETSPPNLAAAQVHTGHLAAAGDPRGWEGAGELSPIRRVASMFSGSGLPGLDGSAWYHPRRLTIDAGAVGAGIANPAQTVLDVRSTHGADLPKLPIYAFGTALGGQRVLDAAQLLATQSGIPQRKLTLVNDSATYAHVDPLSAFPHNDFVDHLLPFLKKVQDARGRDHHGHDGWRD